MRRWGTTVVYQQKGKCVKFFCLSKEQVNGYSTKHHHQNLQGHFRLKKRLLGTKGTNFSHFPLATQDGEVCDQPDQGCNYHSFQQESGNFAISSTENETSGMKLCHTPIYSCGSLQSDGPAAVIRADLHRQVWGPEQNKWSTGAGVLCSIQAKRNGAKTVKWAKMFQSVKV